MLEEILDSIKSVGKAPGVYLASALVALGAIAYAGAGCGETECCRQLKCQDYNMMCDTNPGVNDGYWCTPESEGKDCCGCRDKPSKY